MLLCGNTLHYDCYLPTNEIVGRSSVRRWDRVKMADANKLLEGCLKYRDGKKWKQRWCILQRLSPVADCLHIFLYKEHSECIKSASKSTIVLDDFFGLKQGPAYEREKHVLSIICRNQVVNLAFHNQKTLEVWRLAIVQHLGEGKSFEANLVRAPQSSKVAPGPLDVYINQASICLVSMCSSGSLPHYLASWRIGELRRFGILGNRFCFELEEKSTGGIYLLETSLLNELNHVISNIAHGRNPNSPLLPPKLCQTGTEPAVLKPRLGSPVYKSSSLDYCSLQNADSGKFEIESGNTEQGSSSFRRQLSEPHEFPISAESAVSHDDKAGCYHNIWCCNKVPEKINIAENQRLLCEKLLGGCLEATNDLEKTGSPSSKICCGGHREAGEQCSRDCKLKLLNYINVLSNEPKHSRNCSSVTERRPRPSSARPAARCASSDVLRSTTGEEETQMLLANGGSNGVNDRCRSALVRRASADPTYTRDSLQPLPYVDLRRFDGDSVEGYLYDMKGSQAGHRDFSTAVVRQPASTPGPGRLVTYANFPVPESSGEGVSVPVAGTDAAKPQAVGGRSTFHASLKRQNKFSIPETDLLSFVPPAPSESCTDLRPDLPPTSTLHGSSYYNVRSNVEIPPLPHRSDVKKEPLLAPRKSIPKTIAASFVPSGGKKYVTAEELDVVVPCKSGCRSSENKPMPDVEYVMMNGQSDSEDSAIFFAVNIPMRREDLQRTESNRCESKNGLTLPGTSGPSYIVMQPVVEDSDTAGYVDMSGTSVTDSSKSGSNEGVKLLSDFKPEAQSGEQPKLRHSRSLENELDSPRSMKDPWSAFSRRTGHIKIQKNVHRSPEEMEGSPGVDYIPMDNISLAATEPVAEPFQTFPRPFDDLVSPARCKLHRNSYTKTDQTDDSNWPRHVLDYFVSAPAISSLSETRGSLKSRKSFGLFTRLLRRHSSAKEKAVSENSDSLSGDAVSNVTSGELCEPFLVAEQHQEPSSKADGLSDCSCSSSLERLGPPPPVPACQPQNRMVEKSGGEHYINLSSVSSRASTSVLPSSDTSLDYLNIASSPASAPPPLPPKSIALSKNQEVDSLHRNLALSADRVLEKQPLRSITEDEHEVSPSGDKVHARSTCHSKTPVADGISPATSTVGEADPKPPIPPRSIPPPATCSLTCTASTQRSPRVPISPIVRHLSGSEGKSRKPNLIVNIAPTFERRGSRDDIGSATKVPVQLRHLSDLQQITRVRMVSELSNVSISSGEDSRPSPALTTMRPRYGKEYQCVDRRRLYEEGSPFTPQRSPSTASVFTFDTVPSSLRFGASGNCSSGENSPKYPASIRCRIAGDHVSSPRNVSPIVLDPMVDSPPVVAAKVTLNYAEIDLSSASAAPVASVQRAAGRTDRDKIEYALIDLIATSAASRVGREHARQREDKERLAEFLLSDLKEDKLGIGGRSAASGERKGSTEQPKRTPIKDQRFGFFL